MPSLRHTLSAFVRSFHILLLLTAAVSLLAACSGSPEKRDIAAIAKAMQETGITPQINSEYQAKLQAAKTEAEAEAVVQEMLVFMEGIPNKLNRLDLATPQGREIRDGLSQGIEKIVSGTRELLNTDSRNEAALLAIQKKMLAGQQEMLEAHNQFLVLAGKHGFEQQK